MFKDKIILISGGTKGIGLAIAKAFSKASATVIITGRNKPDFNLADAGIDAFYSFDIAKSNDVQENVNQILEKYKKVDVLVNNAGITKDTLFLRMSEEDWDQVINANLKGTFNLSKSLVKQFMKNKTGNIINITSVVAQTGNPGQANYVASKAGIIGLTKTLALELAPRNIRVNAIAPGFIETQMTDNIPNDYKDAFLKRIPMGKFGRPDNIADATLFLASEQSDYITGQVLNVNGGLYL